MSIKRNDSLLAVGFSVLALVTLVVITVKGFGLEAVPSQYEDKAEIALPVLILASAVALLLSLAFIAAAFAALNLADHTHALALPEGSVRSLIALLLITTFAITSIFLYRQLRFPPTYTSTGLTLEEKDELVKAIPSEDLLSVTSKMDEGSEEAVYAVTRRVEGSEASEDFAEQMLTTVSTLVVAVAGFYFGSRAVAAARGVAAPSSPVIRSITPNDGKQGQELDVSILGEDFQSPTVKLVKGSKEMPGEGIMSSDTKISCKLKIGKEASTGKWDLVVVNKDGGDDRLAEAFDVKPTLPEEPENP